MREIRTSGSEGGGIETNRCSLPLFDYFCSVPQNSGSPGQARRRREYVVQCDQRARRAG